MSRMIQAALLLSLLLAGCGRQERPADPKAPAKVEGVVVAPPAKADDVAKIVQAAFDPIPLFATDPANEKYDAALTNALTLLADQDLPKALDAFEAAKLVKDTEFVRGEIAKLKSRLDADATAKKTVQEIQLVLDDGNPKEARKLLDRALLEFGGGPDAGKLLQLQAQADALIAVQGGEDAKVRFVRLRDQGQVALQDNNLRLAVAVLQQALQIGDDAGVRDQLKGIQDRLDKYDALRRRAAELRRDPNDVDDAQELYRQAALAWNTPEVRNDIDDCALALQKRRDTLSVADFEAVGDLGIVGAGHVIADELLPTFKARFDLIERGQVSKVIEELNLAAGFQNNPEQQRELGKLARVRFLVLGSVRRLGAVTVQARLVDTSSGLIVQTGKLSAPTFEELLPRLPELTKQLLMSDDEKLAFDQEQIRIAQRIEPVPVNAPLPPAPVVGAVGQDPWFNAARPPEFGALNVAQFQALQPAPVVVQQAVIVEPPPIALRSRLVGAVVLQGDGYFARGNYREAFRQFEFALSLAPNDFDIRARLEACRPQLPPPVVVVQPVVRPRLAILNFLVVGEPRIVPPGLSVAAPDWLSPYFRMHYDIVDAGEIYWMMGRLGMTHYDLMNDPTARRWLGRALHAQFFLMGSVEQTASFDVSTYLLNAEHGWLHGSARMHVRNSFDLKVRAGELAHITQLPQAQRVAYLAAQPQVNVLVAKGQSSLNQGNFQIAITFFQDALKHRPGNVQATLFLTQATHAQRQWEIEEARRKELVARQAAAQAAQRRQLELAQAAEAARLLAAQQAAARAEVERRALAQQRANAYGDMVAKARIAIQGKNFNLAVNLFQGALDLSPPPPPGAPAPLVALPVAHNELVSELAQARADVARANEQTALAEKAAAQQSALRQQRDKELAAARQKIADDARKAEAAALAQRQVNDAKYQAAFDQGQLLMSQGKFEAAIVALQGARQLKRSEAVEALLNTALASQAKAVADAKGAAERNLLDVKLAAERKRTKAAEEEAKRNHDLYEAALKSAQEALAKKNLDEAEDHFKSAGKLFNNDAVLVGLQQVQGARVAELAVAKAAKEKAGKSQRAAELLATGKASFDAGRFGESAQTLNQARKLDPTNVDVLAALARAEQARDRALLEQRQKAAEANKAVLIQAAKEKASKIAIEENAQKAAALKQQQEADAKQAAILQAAKEKAAKTALEEEAKKAVAAKEQKAAALTQALELGQKALLAKNYAEAIKAYQDALRLEPKQLQATQGLQQAQSALAEANQAALLKAAKEKAAKIAQEEELKKAFIAKQMQVAALTQALDQGQKAMLAKNYADAIKAYEAALRLEPNQPLAKQGLQQAQTALAAAKTAEANAIKYKDLVAQGRGFIAQKKFAEAIGPLQEALKLQPGEPAAGLLSQAQAAVAALQNQQLAEQKKKASYANSITSGEGLLKQSKFQEALQALQTAKTLYPADPQVNQLIAQTTQAWDAAKKAVVPPNTKKEPPKVDPTKKNVPDDAAKKKAAEERAQYQNLMTKGQELLKQNQYAEAAKQFEAALRLVPNDPVATKMLQQAQKLKK